MRKYDLSEIQLEQEGFKIALKRGVDFPAQAAIAPGPLAYQNAPPAASSGGAQPDPAPAKPKLREITSPMVGTFYASPSPDAPSYVTSGQEVSEDSVVCIIEAMKVMNEIKAELRGTIVEIVAESGKSVQYGQVLFRVR